MPALHHPLQADFSCSASQSLWKGMEDVRHCCEQGLLITQHHPSYVSKHIGYAQSLWLNQFLFQCHFITEAFSDYLVWNNPWPFVPLFPSYYLFATVVFTWNYFIWCIFTCLSSLSGMKIPREPELHLTVCAAVAPGPRTGARPL